MIHSHDSLYLIFLLVSFSFYAGQQQQLSDSTIRNESNAVHGNVIAVV